MAIIKIFYPRKNNERLAYRGKTSGFTLTEIAIVLGIIGLILGGIWVASAQLLLNHRIGVSAQQLTAISQNMRTIFAEQGGVTGNSSSNVNLALDQMKVFPLDMRNGINPSGIIFNLWNTATSSNGGGFVVGTVQIYADDCTGVETSAAPQPCFGVAYFSIPQNACIKLISQTAQGGLGVQSVMINGVTANAPVTPAAAKGICTGANNDILWVFLLKDDKT